MTKKKICLCDYAKSKFEILKEHNFFLTENQVVEAIKNPDKILIGHKRRKIAQKSLDKEHLLRVIFEEDVNEITIVTFYPVRKERYED